MLSLNFTSKDTGILLYLFIWLAVPFGLEHCFLSLEGKGLIYILPFTFVYFFSGIDIIALLKVLHTPAFLIEKVQNVPEAAGELVVALILYKVCSFTNFIHSVL